MILHFADTKLPVELKLFILCIHPANNVLSQVEKCMITFRMRQAKCVIAKSWKSTTKPSTGAWLTGLPESLAMENPTLPSV